MKKGESLQKILEFALFVIAFFVVMALVLIQSQAVNVNTAVSIENVDPTVESIYFNDTAFVASDGYPGGTINTLVAGSTKTIYVNGVVEDLNGRDDIIGVALVFYRSSVSGGSACASDKNQCYLDAVCDTQTNADSSQYDYSCQIQLSYFIDSTSAGGAYPFDNWVAEVSVSDGVATGSDQETKEVQTLLALNVPSSVDFGTLSLGDETSSENNQAMVVTQRGNDEADVEVSSSAAMSCTINGTIPVANQQWSLTDIGYGASGTAALSGTPTDTNLYVDYQTDEATAPTETVYWNIAIPSGGVEGTCSGATTIAALSH